MPRGDGTGPNGMGSMTGRGAGYCAGLPNPGNVQGGFGRGGMRAFGGRAGRGYRNMFYATGLPGSVRGRSQGMGYDPMYQVSPEQEVDMMKSHAQNLKSELEILEKDIQQTEQAQKKE
ncbi:MAG: DUF5320 domain-containing protein [Candidatus Ancaeobacter aquaticus]|nr:DUF5320 domain-containing protein [Candidatus Ancaeobacter aquaticus]